MINGARVFQQPEAGMREHTTSEHGQVLAFVVGWNNYEDVHQRSDLGRVEAPPGPDGCADDQRGVEHGNPESLLGKKH